MKRFLFRYSLGNWVIIGLVIALIGLHFITLVVTPPGFFVDEALTGAHVTSMHARGTDANGTAWPLFSSSVGGGYTTAVYLYPLVGWASIFGSQEFALRAFSAFVTMLAIGALGLSMYLWTHSKKTMCLTWIVGLIIPWAWLGGSVAWDPALLPLFVALAWLGFSGLLNHSRHHTSWFILMSISLLLGAYLYPPFRVSGPLLLFAAAYYAYSHQRITVKQLLSTFTIAGLFALPLLTFLLQPSAMGRTQALSVFATGGVLGGTVQTIVNFLLLLNPITLFVTGDPNLRHSTGFFGMLGGVGLIGACGLIAMWRWPRHQQRATRTILLASSVGVGLALLGSALTNEGQPHYLRATAAWPFFVILITVGWHYVLLARRRYAYAAILLCALLTTGYVADLVITYPARSASAFDTDTRRSIQSGKAVPYPNSAMLYYQQVSR